MAKLSVELKVALDDFKNSGGMVIENKPAWEWHTESGWTTATKAFLKELSPLPSPVQVLGGNEKMHMQAFVSEDSKQLTICMTNDFSWVQVGGKGEEGYVEGDTEESLSSKPSACEDVLLKLERKPKHVFEANTGQELTWTAEGIRVPTFDYLAVIVAEY